ncbi:GTP-binding protein [Clostridium chromiireducens]|uniref:CobW/HypB/UreG, nucleotide-binding domain n=1 Tax=Clostridium chromiireducens TaxID=225345 RepID=A0A1V4IR02_9CLOT|nr:GTP-binding protein [Clostridium chromiireducens]OPJ62366.1 CobW/HypB/UreG, nucleotide-binding domain [Clostridium chromiireducens]
MKINIEIVTGFLSSGKTTFINSLLNESQVEGEKVLIFQLEQGKMRISEFNNSIKVQAVNDVRDLNEEMIYSIDEYNPNRIIIEYNGTSDLKELIDILNQKIYRECCKITTIFFVADGKNLRQYIDNIGSFMIPFIQSANMVIINNIDYCSKDNLVEGVNSVRQINPKAYILKVNNKYILRTALRESKVIDNGYIKKLRIKISNYKRY